MASKIVLLRRWAKLLCLLQERTTMKTKVCQKGKKMNWSENSALCSGRHDESQNKRDSADQKRGSCVSSQRLRGRLGDRLGIYQVLFVAHWGLTACHSAFGYFNSRNFVNILFYAIGTCVTTFVYKGSFICYAVKVL